MHLKMQDCKCFQKYVNGRHWLDCYKSSQESKNVDEAIRNKVLDLIVET